ncbi:hypothetical protein OSCI_1000002 [Kamptonema sp. PCC 6506]|nr:hypothetical protein OSCI_1000002 [Kamptonema sp. PCC 6506]
MKIHIFLLLTIVTKSNYSNVSFQAALKREVLFSLIHSYLCLYKMQSSRHPGASNGNFRNHRETFVC